MAARRLQPGSTAGCYDAPTEVHMAEKVFKKIQIVGCSEKSYQAAVETAVRKAS